MKAENKFSEEKKCQIRKKHLKSWWPVSHGSLPGDDAQDGAIRIFGVISVLSDKRRLGNAAFATRR
jgi:hypothetical protein